MDKFTEEGSLYYLCGKSVSEIIVKAKKSKFFEIEGRLYNIVKMQPFLIWPLMDDGHEIRECIHSSRDFYEVSLEKIKTKGLYEEISETTKLKNLSGLAAVIANLSKLNNCNPIEFIDNI